jgi:hypothetical protein
MWYYSSPVVGVLAKQQIRDLNVMFLTIANSISSIGEKAISKTKKCRKTSSARCWCCHQITGS